MTDVGGNAYQVPGGRRDGNVSVAQETSARDGEREAAEPDLRRQGLSQSDMVALSGAHTIGMLQCSSFNSGAGSTPTGPTPAGRTPVTCRRADGATGPDDADGLRHQLLRRHHTVANRGLLSSDQALLSDPTTAAQHR
ncbi:peroxidase 5-like [Miscanthus floridulus]|uniref:peroxidase 5-like n=1 Tax=Miscanthus floridulus TaxID=154761 RepID=UPI003457A23E